MFERLVHWQGRLSTGQGILFGAATIGVAGLADFFTGPYMWWDFVYVLPVALYAWMSPFRVGWALSVLAGLITLTANMLWDVPDRNSFVPFWNGLVTFVTCFTLAAAIFEIRSLLQKQEMVSRVVSHDLMNVLTAMRMNTDFLLAQIRHDDSRFHTVEAVKNATVRMRRIVGDLKVASQMDGETLEIHPAPVDANRLISEAVDFFKTAAAAKKIRLNVTSTSGPIQIFADRDRIAEALDNLLGNAIKFTGNGGQVDIWLAPNPESVEIHVRDTGPGISAGDRTAIFKPYWKGRLRQDGAGLGLHIAKLIIDRHGGQIWVEGGDGQGAHFGIRLPRGGDDQQPGFSS